MSRLLDWLATRSPSPPDRLTEALRASLSDPAPTHGRGHGDGAGPPPLPDALTDAARRGLDAAIRRPGRVRTSAFRLLEADALFTYACEAALDADASEAALERILVAAAT